MRQKEKKTILVFGATGRQGGAVARRLLAGGWSVRAFTRNAASAEAQTLAALGAELAEGAMEDADALAKAMKGVYGVFSVQPPDWTPTPDSAAAETRLGIGVADAALAAGVRHFVYASVGGADRQALFRESAKRRIELHLAAIGLPATILRPAGFMESLAEPLYGIQNGVYRDATLPTVATKLIAVDDIGAFAALSFGDPETYVGRTIELAGDARTPPEIAAAISRTTGRDIPYAQIPMEAIRAQNEGLAAIVDWLNREGYDADPAALRKLHPGLMTLEDWLDKQGKAKFAELFAHRPQAETNPDADAAKEGKGSK